MRNAFLAAAVLLCAAVPALAQNPMATTQTPPSPNSAQSAPQPDTSLPPAAETSNRDLPGGQLGQASSPSDNTGQMPGRVTASQGKE